MTENEYRSYVAIKCCIKTWWRHQMETFSALLAICAGNSPVHGEFPTQRPVTRSFDVYFDLRPNKWLSKQSWGWWFETLSCSLWRHRNDYSMSPLHHCGYCSKSYRHPIARPRIIASWHGNVPAYLGFGVENPPVTGDAMTLTWRHVKLW